MKKRHEEETTISEEKARKLQACLWDITKVVRPPVDPQARDMMHNLEAYVPEVTDPRWFPDEKLSDTLPQDGKTAKRLRALGFDL